MEQTKLKIHSDRYKVSILNEVDSLEVMLSDPPTNIGNNIKEYVLTKDDYTSINNFVYKDTYIVRVEHSVEDLLTIHFYTILSRNYVCIEIYDKHTNIIAEHYINLTDEVYESKMFRIVCKLHDFIDSIVISPRYLYFLILLCIISAVIIYKDNIIELIDKVTGMYTWTS